MRRFGMSPEDGSPGDPVASPAVPVTEEARIVADASLSDELVEALENIVRRPIAREPSAGATGSSGDRTRLVYVGPTLPDHLRDERLLWFHSTNAGVDAVLRDGPWPPGAVLTRTVGRMGERIAQYVLGWILAECQEVPAFLDQQRERAWRRLPTELAGGQVAVVFGVGRIGAAVAGLLRRCGIRTVGVAGHRRQVAGCDSVVTAEHVHEVLPEARWVVSTLPLTSATRGMFDAEVFGLMKGATFVNVGRGATVDMDALAAALADGTVRGAVLDVLPDEPVGPEAACWDLPRTVVTSHSSGITNDEDVVSDFAACWDALGSGRLPDLAVLPGRGY